MAEGQGLKLLTVGRTQLGEVYEKAQALITRGEIRRREEDMQGYMHVK